MKLQHIPRLADGSYDLNFLRNQPIFNDEVTIGAEKLTVEMWAKVNSLANNSQQQV